MLSRPCSFSSHWKSNAVKLRYGFSFILAALSFQLAYLTEAHAQSDWKISGPFEVGGTMVCQAESPNGFGIRFHDRGSFELGIFDLNLEDLPIRLTFISESEANAAVVTSNGYSYTGVFRIVDTKIDSGRVLYLVSLVAEDARLLQALKGSYWVKVKFTDDNGDSVKWDTMDADLSLPLAGSAKAIASAKKCIDASAPATEKLSDNRQSEKKETQQVADSSGSNTDTDLAAGTYYCPKGGLYQGTNVNNVAIDLTVNRIGLVYLPHHSDPEGKRLPAFALDMLLDNGEPAYAYGFLASYTFLVDLEFLEHFDVQWPSRTEHKDSFFRIMEDDGKEPILTVNFSRCR